MNKDIRIKTENINFKFRVSGIIIKNKKVLLVEIDDSGFLCLPGGYVELEETTEEACLRELKEEIGKNFKIDKYCGVIENYFRSKYNINMHEIAFYYKTSPIDKLDTKDFILKENDKGNIVKLNFQWIDLEELNKYNIKPNVLKDILKTNLEFNHLVVKNK